MSFAANTGSLVNHLHARGTVGQPTPTVGMGATLLSYTDRHPATIVAVTELSSKRWKYQVELTEDRARRVDSNGMSESQEYEFTTNPDARRQVFRMERDGGRWIEMRRNDNGRWIVSHNRGLRIGERDKYHDFSF